MPRLHVVTPKPSPLLAVVSLAVVHRLHPEWVAIPLADAAATEDLSAQRLSRLCSRAISLFEAAVGNLVRRGRPPKVERDAEAELAQARALLDVATSLLQAVSLRGNKVRVLLVGAWLRLQQGNSTISCRRFCATLGVSERAFRRWRNAAAVQVESGSGIGKAEPVPSKPKPSPPRRGRFNFDVTLPETQFAADTTDLNVFGIKLKLIGSQDVGGRDNDLLDSIIVDTREDAARVEQVFRDSLANLEGAQAITDQGTPYMAELTRKALEDLEIDHAPQREGDPLGKATIERAFGTVKTIAAPIFALTGRLARHCPSLGRPELATAFARLVVTFLLRAYQAGARAAHRADEQRGGLDEQTLARLAAENRDKAHAELRSKRMLLEHIYQTLGMNGSKTEFIRQFSSRPLPVLESAQKDFGRQAHRDDIRSRTGYFAWFVKKHLDVYNQQQAKLRGQRERDQQRAADEQRKVQREHAWKENPAQWLMDALKTIAAFWLPDTAVLAGGGAGPGTAWMRGAIARLVELHGTRAALDIAHGTADVFGRAAIAEIGEQGVSAVLETLFDELRRVTPQHVHSRKVAEQFVATILARDGPS
jgi:hypothetical protein